MTIIKLYRLRHPELDNALTIAIKLADWRDKTGRKRGELLQFLGEPHARHLTISEIKELKNDD